MGKRGKTNTPGRRRLKGILSNLILLLIVIIISLVIVEAFLRLAYPSYSNFNTEMWRYSRDIKRISDVEGVSHEHMPNKESMLYGVEFKTNSLGFRDIEYPVAKPEGTRRILVLGDSVTLGWGVNMSDIYTEVLERTLNENSTVRYEVLNAAVGNYNTEMEANILGKYIYLDPDAVIIGFFPNDGEKTMLVKPGLVYFLKKNLYIYPFFWDRYMRLKYTLESKKNGSYTGSINDFYTEEYGGKKAIENSFRKLSNITKNSNIKVYVVIIPHFYEEFSDYDAGYLHEFVMEQCMSNNFTCIDTLEEFRTHKLSEIIVSKEDSHPNRLGHSIIAESIYKVISNG